MLSHTDLLEKAQEIASFYGADKPTSNNNNWHIRCPICDSPDALHMTATDRLVFHCFACKSPMPQLLTAILKDGFDPGVRATNPAPVDKKKSHLIPNKVAHEQNPDWESVSLFDSSKDQNPHPVTRAYRYEDEMGRLVFLALEAETQIPNTKKPGKFVKIRKPYTSTFNTLTNTNVWYMGQLMSKDRPLYNLPKIVSGLDKPILVVEGEGTAIIAQIQNPGYAVTTWSQGMSAWKATNLSPLQNRKVILWPDNSEDSIKNFMSLAANIQPTPKIAFLVPFEDRPIDWDLADETTEGMWSVEFILSQAIQLTPKDLKGNSPLGNEDEIVAKYNQHLRTLSMNGKTIIYDIKYKQSDDSAIIPYVYHNTRYDLQLRYSKKVELDDKRKGKPLFEIDVWLESENKIACDGIEYDPTQDMELLKQPDGSNRLNRFTGYATKPTACSADRYDCFMNHINFIMDPVSAAYVLDWLAQMIQEPTAKPGVMVVLTGRPLSGKTIIGVIMQSMLGRNNVAITDGKSFSDGNTGSVSGKVLGIVNEFKHDKVDEEWLKTAITDDRVTFVDKYVKKFTERSCLRLLGTTNHPIVLGADDRRIFPIDVVNSKINNIVRQDPANLLYYKQLDKLKFDQEALSGLHAYLKTVKITQNVQATPKTEYRESMLKPESVVQQIVYEIANYGCMPNDFPYYIKPRSGEWTEPHDARYPKFVAKEWLIDFAIARGSKGTHINIGKEFNKYIPTESITPKTDVSFLVTDRKQSVERLEPRKMVFEIPIIQKLRDKYNEMADHPVAWPDMPDNVVPFKKSEIKPTISVTPKSEDII